MCLHCFMVFWPAFWGCPQGHTPWNLGSYGILDHGLPCPLDYTCLHTLDQGPKLGQSGCLTPFSESTLQALSFGILHNPIPQPHVGAEGHGPHHGVGQLRGYHFYRFLSVIKVVQNEVLSPNCKKTPNFYPESGSKIGSIGIFETISWISVSSPLIWCITQPDLTTARRCRRTWTPPWCQSTALPMPPLDSPPKKTLP